MRLNVLLNFVKYSWYNWILSFNLCKLEFCFLKQKKEKLQRDHKGNFLLFICCLNCLW